MARRITQKDIDGRDDATQEWWEKNCEGLSYYGADTAWEVYQSGFEGGEHWTRGEIGRFTSKKKRLITQGVKDWEDRLHQHTDYWLAFTMGWDAGEEYSAEARRAAKKKTTKKVAVKVG